jgi:hypothetical protein
MKGEVVHFVTALVYIKVHGNNIHINSHPGTTFLVASDNGDSNFSQ